jgi:hypothetical protein
MRVAWVVQNEQQTWQSFPKEKCKLLQDGTKQELECSLLGRKKLWEHPTYYRAVSPINGQHSLLSQ